MSNWKDLQSVFSKQALSLAHLGLLSQLDNPFFMKGFHTSLHSSCYILDYCTMDL